MHSIFLQCGSGNGFMVTVNFYLFSEDKLVAAMSTTSLFLPTQVGRIGYDRRASISPRAGCGCNFFAKTQANYKETGFGLGWRQSVVAAEFNARACLLLSSGFSPERLWQSQIHTREAIKTEETLAPGIQVRCVSKPATRVLREADMGRGDAAKFVLRKSRSLSRGAQLEVLEELVRRGRWEVVLPVYEAVRKEDWYKWNPKLYARILAMVTKSEGLDALTSDLLGLQDSLTLKQKVDLGCALIESYAYQGLQNEAQKAFQTLSELPIAKARPLGYKAMVHAYARLGNPVAAESLLREMRSNRYSTSTNEWKALLFSYGKSGMLIDMERIAEEIQRDGMSLEPAGFNMMISAYCLAESHEKMLATLSRMDEAGTSPNIVTWNALTKACPTLASVAFGGSCALLNPSTLLNRLHQQGASPEEVCIVQALLTRGIPAETLSHSSTSCQLDMHKMSVGTASVVLPLWLRYLSHQLDSDAHEKVPLEVRLVTGWGKHSEGDVKAPVRTVIINELAALASPFRIDSQNRGAIYARASSVKKWLLTS